MLTEKTIQAAKAAEKPTKLFDGGGLYLLVNPQGSRLWRLKYRVHGKEKLLAIGAYPDVSLKRAREKRDDARRLLADGIDPNAQRRAEKLAAADTFEAIAREWLELQHKKLSPTTYVKALWIFETLLFPSIGSQPIRKLTAADVLAVVRRIEARGKHETAHRAKQRCGQVIRFAISTGRADRDPTSDLRGALAPVVRTNRPAITEPAQIGQLLNAIDSYTGHASTAFALKLAPLLFVRPGELRGARWEEFELDAKEPLWRIPAERMKMRETHVVPLSKQVVKLLDDLRPWSGTSEFLFPSVLSNQRPISDNTINSALRRLGYASDEMCGHGFRAMASTRLNEQGWHPDIIELQLAHAERNKVRAAYNRAERLTERRKMMQAWADYLDVLRAGAKVVPLRFSA
ncbi:tyrosine-type recombinase/integrase [Steroidobacter agaridevorans]|uniref:tyrosine-type recombinase/integrase n=1 Tax=Steroidobacter agaridevorans TaxID=2695856 RepID=UPI00132A7841|nr:integrase arm-type DNA-binding domain-containing protein [Steroidobacter agaridevorans]GFE91331.1 integrase [Steroidobacter agaridevorans]